MKKMLSLVLCVLMLAGVFALASCGTNGDDTSDTSKTSGSGESSGSAGAESSSAGTDDKEALKAELKATFLKLADEVVVDDDSVTFQDASGDTPVTIRKNPQKVVNLYASFTTLWYEAGGTVVGKMAILAEGDAQDREDLIYLEKLPLFHPDGTVMAE